MTTKKEIPKKTPLAAARSRIGKANNTIGKLKRQLNGAEDDLRRTRALIEDRDRSIDTLHSEIKALKFEIETQTKVSIAKLSASLTTAQNDAALYMKACKAIGGALIIMSDGEVAQAFRRVYEVSSSGLERPILGIFGEVVAESAEK